MYKLLLVLTIIASSFSCVSEEHYQSNINRQADITTTYEFPAGQNAWQDKEGKLVALEEEQGMVETNIGQAFKQAFAFSFVNKYAIIVNGTTAFYSITENKPVFYVSDLPTNLVIAKMTIEENKNRRYFNLVHNRNSSVAYVHPVSAQVDYDWAKTQNGKYKITVTTPLESGEYAICGARNMQYFVYCFKN